MKKTIFLSIICACILPASWGQTFPYSPNKWSNSEFVDRFLGSYGVETSREPKINSDEGELFQEVAILADTNLKAAADLLAQSMTPESSAALNYTLANLYLQSGNVDGAIRQYKESIRKFPNFMRAYKNLGLALIQEGNYKEAQKVLVKAIELGDGAGNTYGLLAFTYLNTDRMDSALDAYRIASVLMPDNKDWKIGKAHALLQTGRYEDAAAMFGELILEDPTNKQFYISRSNAYLYVNEYDKAAHHLDLVRRIGGATGSSLHQLGNLYLSMNIPQLAYTAFQESLTAQEPIPQNKALGILSSLLSRFHYTQAENFLVDLKNQYGDRFSNDQTLELLNLEAELNLAQGQNEEAANILEKVVQRDPLNGNAFYLLGNYYWSQDDAETAVFYFERAQTVKDTEYKALLDHARLLVQEQEFVEALPLLKRAQSLEPKDSVAQFISAVEQVVERIGN